MIDLLNLSYLGYFFLAIGLFMFYKVFNPLAVALYYKFKYGELVVIKFWPLLGAFGHVFLGQALGDSQKWIRQVVTQNPKAKFIMSNFCFQPQLMIIDAAYAKEVLMVHSSKYIWTDLLFASELFMDQGLVATQGKKWKQQRTTLAKVFHFDHLKKRIPPIQQVAQEKIDKLMNRSESDMKKPINVISESQVMTGEVVVRSFFGKKFDKSEHMGMNVNDTIQTFVQDCAHVSMDPYFSLKRILLGKKLGTKLFQSKKEKAAMKKVLMLRSLAFEMIDERLQGFDTKKSDDQKDFLDHYLCAYLENNPEDNKITKEEIVQQFITMYFAGMDTTANLTAKVLYMLAQHPDVYQRVEKEINEIVPDITKVTGEDLNKLNVTTAYIKEILRFSSPAYILGFRSATEDFTICNELKVPKGMVIDISFHGILRNPLNFEEPERFNIDRFLKTKELNPAYLPFGAGPRNCIGQHLAQFEAKVFLMYYLHNFKLQLDETKLPIRMGGTLMYEPSDKEILIVEPKKKTQ